MKKMMDLEFNRKKMTGDKADTMTYHDYEKLRDDPAVREKVILTLKDKHEHLISNNVEEISKTMKYADKDLYLQFKDGLITLDQLKSRIAERRDKINYVCLDDMKKRLDPKYFEGERVFKKSNQNKDPNSKASVSYVFQQVSRAKAPPQYDYMRLPETLGTVDFY